MRIARFADVTGKICYGVVDADSIDVIDGDIFGQWRKAGTRVAMKSVRLLSPVVPSNFLCLGKNYRSFAGEENPSFPKEPLLFIKATSAVVGPDEAIVVPAMAPNEVYYEAELAVIIGRVARSVSENDALKYVLGYTVSNDVGAKDCQAKDGQWARAKSFDTFAPVGPWIETELDTSKLKVSSRVNGTLVQDSTTELMIFNVPYTISYLSKCMTLLPGTVISMGSPGVLKEPRPFLKAGDIVEAEVEGVGVLKNKVVAQK
ncbi:MAG: fumarylacetoacetate hydrolase family protein [Sedimentisphaerales bacterium]|nr:fumarylacetoacetate hydrolase family protein [Sedimentisphaerales bacterium]